MLSVPVPAKPEVDEAKADPLDSFSPNFEDAKTAKALEAQAVALEDSRARERARFEELLEALRDEFLRVERRGGPLPSLPGAPEADGDGKRLLPADESCLHGDLHPAEKYEEGNKAADSTVALDSDSRSECTVDDKEEKEEEEEETVKFHRKPHGKVAVLMDTVPAAVIVLNSIILGLSLDHDPDGLIWQILEVGFVCFYTGEFVTKLKLFGLRWYFCSDDMLWNSFDLLCLILMYLDLVVTTYLYFQRAASTDEAALSGLAIIKLFRLARLARLIRALRFKVFLELRIIVLGVFSGLRVLLWAFVLLVVIVYGLGVALRNVIGDQEEEFSSLAASMLTIFRCFTDGCAAYDGTPLSVRLRKSYGGVFMIIYIFIITLVTMGFFNLIMAVFIDNVMSSQFIRKQAEISDTSVSVGVSIKEKMVEFLRHAMGNKAGTAEPVLSRSVSRRSQQLDDVLDEWDQDVSRETFEEWLEDEEFVRVLEDASIDMSCRGMLFDVLDADAGGELSTSELVTGLMRLRGPVTKLDVIGVSLKVSHLVNMLEGSRSEGMQRQVSVRSGGASPSSLMV